MLSFLGRSNIIQPYPSRGMTAPQRLFDFILVMEEVWQTIFEIGESYTCSIYISKRWYYYITTLYKLYIYIYTLPDQLGTESCLSTGGPTKSKHSSPDLKTLGMLSQQGTSGDVPEVNSDNKKLPSQKKQQRIIPELGCGFKYFLFSSLFGEMIQFD